LRSLDGLRALAVTMVVIHNYGPLPGLSRYPRVSSLRAGYIGVTIFFVLSGFLITLLLIEEFSQQSTIRLKAFYTRRAYRLFPALTVCLALLIAISISLSYLRHDIIVATLSVVAYIFNFVAYHQPVSHPLGGGGWGHLWSLSVEEQFYFVWPVVLLVLLRRMGQRTIMWILLAGAAGVTIWRTHLWLGEASFFRLYLLTDSRVDALLIGAALAIASRNYPALNRMAARWSVVLLPGIVILVLLADFGSSAETDTPPGWLVGPGMIVVSVISALLVIVSINTVAGRMSRILNSKLAIAVGRRSYGIYLYHFPVLAWVSQHRGGWLFAFFLTLVITELSYRLIEQPILRRAPKWSRRAAVQAPVAAG